MADIFISHSTRDDVAARTLALEMRKCGFQSLFVDHDRESGIVAGSNWESILYDKLTRTRVVIVLHSKSWRESRWCFAEVSHAKVLGRPIIPISLDETPLDDSLSALQSVKWSAEDLTNRILEGLRAAGLSSDWRLRPDLDRIPFPGLASFQESDSAVFFGRDEEVRDILDTIAVSRVIGGGRLIVLTGPSGSGKSSLLRAGVLPRLRADPATWSVSDAIRVHTYKMGFLKASIEESRADIDTKTVVISIDQLEESLATQSRNDNNALWSELSETLRDPQCRLIVLGTIRTDALSGLEVAADRAGLKVKLLHVAPIDREGLTAAIAGPCQLYGIAVEDGLTERIVRDCADWRALPALAYTLRAMFDETRPPRRFTSALYESLGGVSAILNKHISEITEASGLPRSDLRKTLFGMVRLSDSGEFNRVAVTRTDLAPAAGPLIDQLVNAHVLVSDTRGGEQIVELAHESLLFDWEMLANWLKEYREYFEWKRRFEAAVEEFDRHGAVLSYGGVREAERWVKEGLAHLDAGEVAFLRASKEQSRFFNFATRAWTCVRIGVGPAGIWLLTGMAVTSLAGDSLLPSVLSAFSAARYHDTLVLTGAFSLAGLLAGCIAFGWRILAALSGLASFFVLLTATALVSLPTEDSGVAAWSVPFTLAAPLVLFLCVQAASKRLSRSLIASLAFLVALRLLISYFYGLHTFEYNNYGVLAGIWNDAARAGLALPSGVRALIRAAGFRASAYVLFACGIFLALSFGLRSRKSAGPPAAGLRLYPLVLGILSALMILLLPALVPLTNRQTRRYVEVDNAAQVAQEVLGLEEAFKQRENRYTNSLLEVDGAAHAWVQETAHYCEAQAERIPYEPLPKTLLSESDLGYFSLTGILKSLRIHLTSGGWWARITGTQQTEVGCSVWGGDPAAALAAGFPSTNEASGDHTRCDHVLFPYEGLPLVHGSTPPLTDCETFQAVRGSLHK